MIHSFSMEMPECNMEGRIAIELPFNVWEVFNKKGAMRVKGSINKLPYEYSLIPRGNGTYLLPMNKKIITQAKITTGSMLDITMALVEDTPSKKEQESVAAVKGKIKSINYVQQPNFEACGQACVAMLADVDVQEVIKVMNTKGPTSIGQIIEALDYYQIPHAERNKRISKKNPNCSEISILTVHMPNYTHWVLYYKGKYYDPEFGVLEECHPEGKITSFLEIY